MVNVVGKLLLDDLGDVFVLSFFNSLIGDGGVTVVELVEGAAETPIIVERGRDDLRTGETLPREGDALRAGDIRERVDLVAGAGIWVAGTTTSSLRLGLLRVCLRSIIHFINIDYNLENIYLISFL